MFQTSELIFNRVASVNSVDMEMPNIHYYVADLKKIGIPNSGEVKRRFSMLISDIVVNCYTVAVLQERAWGRPQFRLWLGPGVHNAKAEEYTTLVGISKYKMRLHRNNSYLNCYSCSVPAVLSANPSLQVALDLILHRM